MLHRAAMLDDLSTFLVAVFLNVSFFFGVVTLALRWWAERMNEPWRNFLGRPRLWTAMTFVFLGIACFQAWRAEHHAAQAVQSGAGYALVSSDGTIVSQKNFAQYGMTVKTVQEHPSWVPGGWTVYQIKFEREPEHFIIRTDDGATPGKNQVGPHEYRVVFVGVGFGDPVVTANFRVEAD
jgi:hypothetical protein